MSDLIHDTSSMLSGILEQETVNWQEFDAALKGLENINVIDEEKDETILSEVLLDTDYSHNEEIVVEIVQHFLANGYDVLAHEGKNGGFALNALCYALCGRYTLEAAKVLMNAGAPIVFRTSEDEPDEEPRGLLGMIGWRQSGGWITWSNGSDSNLLEAYYVMTEANRDGKDYNSIDHDSVCIGRQITGVSTFTVNGQADLQEKGEFSSFSVPLILWFGELPLLVNLYAECLVNPVYVDDHKEDLLDVSAAYSPVLGTTLQKIVYLGPAVFFLQFSNGMQLLFSSKSLHESEHIGSVKLQECSDEILLEELPVQAVLAYSQTGSSTGNTAALLCEDAVYLLVPVLDEEGNVSLQIGRCPKEFPDLMVPSNTEMPQKLTGRYEDGKLVAVCVEFAEERLHISSTEDGEIEFESTRKEENQRAGAET